MKADVNTLPLRDPHVWVRRTKDEIAAYDPRTGSLHLFNETALAIWDLCDGGTRPDEMVAAICEVSGLHESIVTEDVGRTLDDFAAAGILHWQAIEADD